MTIAMLCCPCDHNRSRVDNKSEFHSSFMGFQPSARTESTSVQIEHTTAATTINN